MLAVTGEAGKKTLAVGGIVTTVAMGEFAMSKKKDTGGEEAAETCPAGWKVEQQVYWCAFCDRAVAEKRCPFCGMKARKKRLQKK